MEKITLKNKKLFYQLNATAIPLILSSIVGVVMGMIDQAFIGHISIYAYAGVGLVLSCINSIVGVLGAITVFYNIHGSTLSGGEEYQKLNEIFSVFMIICFVIGTVLAVVFNIFCNSILERGFGLTGAVLAEAAIYLRVYSLSIPLNLLIFIFSSTLKIFKQTKYLFLCSVIVNIINIFLDYVLVFGKLYFPRLETLGAAIGTVISLAVNLFIYYMLARKYVTFSVRIPNMFKKIFCILYDTLPFIAQEALEDVIFVIGINSVVAGIGVLALSTYTLITQITNIFLMPMFGYTTANTIFVSENYGQKNYRQIPRITMMTMSSLLIWFFVLYAGLTCFSPEIVKFITDDSDVIYYACQIVPLALFIHLFNYYFSTCKSALQCLGFEKWALLIAFCVNGAALAAIVFFGSNLKIIYTIMGSGYLGISIIYSRKLFSEQKKLMNESYYS